MPLSRQQVREKPLPASTSSQESFSFPAGAHLLITTPGHIYTWDAAGIHSVFRSHSNGILAAREAQDGSGILAVADRNVVILHDTKRGQERSWGLNADEDEVRHLEYTTDAKSLFLSTNLTSDIHRYSAEQSRLLNPTIAHSSSPVAIAVSPTGHLMVSASDNPPTVYISNLAHNSSPVLLEPRASEAAVTCIAFHPERPDIFLLGFADGAVAAFDSTKIARKPTGSLANQESLNRGEIGRLQELHRPILQGNRTRCIEAAAFLPGHRTRAVTVGRDGKCRFIDFADGGIVLRTWHARAPVTSVSVIQRMPAPSRKQTVGSSRPIQRPRHEFLNSENIIAIGRIDGVTQLYDSIGLLLEQKALRAHERIISVDWVAGKSPRPITNSIVARGGGILPILDIADTEDELLPTTSTSPDDSPRLQKRTSTALNHLGLPPASCRPGQGRGMDGGTVRQFAVHPNEMVEGTVRHTPLATSNRRGPGAQQHYLDLFSPVKTEKVTKHRPSQKPVSSPPRPRPQLSSQTFVKSPMSDSLFQLDASTTAARHAGVYQNTRATLWKNPMISFSKSPMAKRPAFGVRASDRRRSSRRSSKFTPISGVVTNDNARILADLRKLGANHTVSRPEQQSSTRPTTHAYQRADKSIAQTKPSFFHRPKDAVETELLSEYALDVYEDAHDRQRWRDDSHQGSSLGEDIWLTSDDEQHTTSRRRRRAPPERPPARQTSRTRIDSKGTMNTTNCPAGIPPAQPETRPFTVDGSTEEEMFTAREMCISSNGMLSPSSRDIQELFPRSSSLSPRKSRKTAGSSKNDTAVRSQHSRILRETTGNAPTPRHNNTPRARTKFGKGKSTALQGVVIDETLPVQDPKPTETDHTCCNTCDMAHGRMQDLEREVGRLKGEVLVLKAVLRRQGLPMPPSLRR